jgi:hypothetical protein
MNCATLLEFRVKNDTEQELHCSETRAIVPETGISRSNPAFLFQMQDGVQYLVSRLFTLFPYLFVI